MPASLHARMTRTAISPRFATRTFCSGLTSAFFAGTGLLEASVGSRGDYCAGLRPHDRSRTLAARPFTGLPDGSSVNNVITGVHTLIYAEDAEAARAFFRDVLQLPCADPGGGWLIFKTGPSELGTHPSSWEYAGTTGGTDQAFDVSLMCDDLAATMA